MIKRDQKKKKNRQKNFLFLGFVVLFLDRKFSLDTAVGT